MEKDGHLAVDDARDAMQKLKMEMEKLNAKVKIEVIVTDLNGRDYTIEIPGDSTVVSLIEKTKQAMHVDAYIELYHEEETPIVNTKERLVAEEDIKNGTKLFVIVPPSPDVGPSDFFEAESEYFFSIMEDNIFNKQTHSFEYESLPSKYEKLDAVYNELSKQYDDMSRFSLGTRMQLARKTYAYFEGDYSTEVGAAGMQLMYAASANGNRSFMTHLLLAAEEAVLYSTVKYNSAFSALRAHTEQMELDMSACQREISGILKTIRLQIQKMDFGYPEETNKQEQLLQIIELLLFPPGSDELAIASVYEDIKGGVQGYLNNYAPLMYSKNWAPTCLKLGIGIF